MRATLAITIRTATPGVSDSSPRPDHDRRQVSAYDGREGRPPVRSTSTSRAFPLETQARLRELRALVKAAAPGATERISYAMPTFDLNGKRVFFAGFARHIGFYPGASGVEEFKEELKVYKSAKGSVQFPLDRPLPTGLIDRMVRYHLGVSAGRAARR